VTAQQDAQDAQDEALVDVYLTVAVRTSAGPGPGHKQLPAAEAGRLVGERRAIYGTQSPRGFGDRLDTGLNSR
jgi:hypothetical protein